MIYTLTVKGKEMRAKVDVLVAESQLGPDRVSVGVHGACPYIQKLGDLFAAPAFFDEGGHLYLCRRETGVFRGHLLQEGGDDVVIVEGTAELLVDQDISTSLPEYVEKYGTMMRDLGYKPESFAADFSHGIRITPTKIRNWA